MLILSGYPASLNGHEVARWARRHQCRRSFPALAAVPTPDDEEGDFDDQDLHPYGYVHGGLHRPVP